MRFAKIVIDFHASTIFGKLSIFDVWKGSEDASRNSRDLIGTTVVKRLAYNYGQNIETNSSFHVK